MSEIETIKNWMDEPIPVHEFTADNASLVVSDETRVVFRFGNVTYVYTEGDARPVYEEDFGEVDPNHYHIHKNGMDWTFDGEYVSITGDVEGIPCEAFWKLDRVEVRG